MIIRPENPSDYSAIYNLVKTAFETAKVSNGDEQNYVDKLRVSGNYLPEFALVAEQDGEIVGHIMLTKTYVTSDKGQFEGLLLAPLCVALGFRSRGIGSKLVHASFELAKKLSFGAVFVVGNPAYYGRFGFVPCAQFGIVHVPEIQSEYVLGLELANGALAGVNGTVNFM